MSDTNDDEMDHQFMDSNLQAAFKLGVRQNNLEPRLRFITHPFDDGVAVPVRMERGTDGQETVRLADDVLGALEKRAGGPARRAGTFRLTELASFLGYVNRYKSANKPVDPSLEAEGISLAGESVVYADTKAFAVTCVFDDHPPGDCSGDAAWREHRAIYTCPRSAEWLAWTEHDGQPLGQVAFGDFLEERLADLTAGEGYPRPLEVLEMARRLQIKMRGEFKREIDPTTGTQTLINSTQHETGSTVIHRAFELTIPVF